MKLLEIYLLYLCQEREYNTKTENPDSFDIKNFEDLVGQKIDLGIFKQMRHTLQPSLYNLYIKNALGDYMGRPDTMNAQTVKHIGFSQFQRDLNLLKKRVKFALKIKEKIPNNFFKNTSRHGETNDPSNDSLDSGGEIGGDSGGDGGGD